jgi:hypothetical protein
VWDEAEVSETIDLHLPKRCAAKHQLQIEQQKAIHIFQVDILRLYRPGFGYP